MTLLLIMLPILQTSLTSPILIYILIILLSLILFSIGLWIRPQVERMWPNLFPQQNFRSNLEPQRAVPPRVQLQSHGLNIPSPPPRTPSEMQLRQPILKSPPPVIPAESAAQPKAGPNRN